MKRKFVFFLIVKVLSGNILFCFLYFINVFFDFDQTSVFVLNFFILKP